MFKKIYLFAIFVLIGCSPSKPISMTGVTETVAEVKVGSDGLTNEQRNIKERLALENDVGSIKHLYLFSSMTGKCMLYSTVKGKVTSSGKRLSPNSFKDGIPVKTPNGMLLTSEAIQDDGTYGSSIEYLYWFDVKGTYRQLFPPSGCVLVLSTEPLSIPENEISLKFTN